jgi:hypothetical protein
MKPGDIGLVRISGFVGFLIRLGQWLCGDGFGDFEHAFVYIGDGKIVEAEPGGARIADLTEYVGKTVRVIPAPTAEIGLAVADAARRYVGVGYSALDYDYIAIRRRLRWLAWMLPWLKKRIASEKRMICSQLADAAAYVGTWDLFDDGRWEGDVTPGDLDELWEKLPVHFSFVEAA